MRKIKVRAYRNPARPNLKFVVGFRQSGKRSQKFFETKEEAKSFADFKNAERKNNGLTHAAFPETLRIMAQECTDALRDYGKTIRDAVDHYLAHLKASEKSCTAQELVKELVKAKAADGVGKRHLDDLRTRLGVRGKKKDKISPTSFAATFNDKLVAEISSAQIDDWLRSLDVGPQTRNHYRANVLQAFNFAVRHGYAPTNPVEGASKAKVVRETPGILSVEEAGALLVNAAPEILPYFAIGLFAGLRRAEIERLDWSEVDFESGLIEVTAAKAKTAQRRFVTLQPNLRAWLLPLRKLKGPITPPRDNFRQLFTEARIAAGITDWPDNALRHSFASYHLAHFKNAASTALELGHHDSRVTFAHYRELVKPKEAARYWKLRPAAKGRKIVQMVEAR
jgi:Site-specific recombinase XerD